MAFLRKLRAGIMGAALLSAALSSCRKAESPPERSVTLTLKWLFDPGFAGEMVAAKSGLFAKEGLAVRIQPGGFETDPIRLVSGGASEFGVAGADSFLIARSRGVPIVALAAGYIRTPVAYYYRANSGIRSISDLKGKTVGLQAGQDTETLLYAMLGRAGVPRASLSFYPVKYDLTPFLRGEIAVWPGYVATQSYILRQQKVAFGTIRPKDVGLEVPGTVYFTSEKFLKENPAAVAGFVRAVRAGWSKTYGEPEKAVSIISSYDPKALAPDLVRANLEDQRDQVLPEGYKVGEIRRADWERLRVVLAAQNLLKGSVDLDDALQPR